jgi:PAS domain S-box-containing protein
VSEALTQILADAAKLTGAPVALAGYVTDGVEHVKAWHGWQVATLPGAYSLAALAMTAGEPVIIADASADPRLAAHPLVTAAPFLRFFASAPILDDDGKPAGALTVVDRTPHTPPPLTGELLRLLAARVRDTGALARVSDLEAAVAESSERFRDFFERTTDLIASIDAEGVLLHANDAFLNTLAVPREQLVRQPLVRVIEPAGREPFMLAFREVIASGEPRTIETVFVTATGQPVTVEGSFQPKMLDGRAVLARVILRDISERKAFEAELGAARDAALEAARLKTQFLTNVSHEIRTPMNGIIGMIDLLLATNLGEEQSDFAHQARASAEQLLSIVNNILSVSSVQAGGLAAANVDFDLYRLVQRIVEVMKVAALGKDVEVALEWDDKLPALFRGQQAKLRQVIVNLMENAVKFTEQGRIVLRALQQTVTATHRVVRFEVSDSGIGIDAEDRLLLFEKFSQIEATQTRRFAGVGLGLATARHLVETMGGLIDVDSRPGLGSTFWFTITFPATDERQPIASADLSFGGKRVLLADQFLISRRIVRHYLESWEMRVDVCDTAREAMAMLTAAAAAGDPYRVAVFSTMPDAGELAFARGVRADAALAGTGLVFLTPANRPLDEAAMREAGIQAYALKPVGQAEIFDALTIAVARDAIGRERSALRQMPLQTPPPPVPPERRAAIQVLLVEDNFLNMKLTLSQLQKLGYRAGSAANGREALEAMGRTDYDVVIMDCQMPVMDGYEATLQIRRRDGARHRHIIAMTANALEGDREKCLAAGMDDYLSKPTRQEELEAALGRYFGLIDVSHL